MGKKMLVSLAMEGKFGASEGLQAMEEGDDLLMAMARELVVEQRIGETADQVWAKLRKEQEEALGVGGGMNSGCNGESQRPTDTVPEGLHPPPKPMPEVVTQLLMFGNSLSEALRRSRGPRRTGAAATTSGQLGLFGG